MVATVSLECKNLFAYSENNPITGKDSSGGIIESAFDIVTLAGSIVDVCCHPTDPWAWAGLVGDAVDLIPVVTGVGEGIKGLRVAAKAAEVADNAHDAGKAAEATVETAQIMKNVKTTTDDSLLKLDLQFFADDSGAVVKRQTPDQKALLDLAKESAKSAKKGAPISYDEARILDEWAKEYNVRQHHPAYLGSGQHFPGGNYMDHTHIYNVHVPYVYR